MSKVVEGFTIERKSREATYNWDELLDGQIRELKSGTDFKAKPASFRNMAHGVAKKRGGSIESRIDEGRGVIQLRYVNKPPRKRTAKKAK